MITKYIKQKINKSGRISPSNFEGVSRKARRGSLFLFLLLLSTFFSFPSFAQHPTDLKINEMFINNYDNLIDEYGQRVPWMEIYNTSTYDVNIAECFLTNDTTGLASKEMEDKAHWYKIPKGDSRTLIPQRGYLVFFLDGMPNYGTLHTNFNPLEVNSNNYVALINTSGHELIHLFSYPEDLRISEKSYGYAVDYGPEMIIRDSIEVPNLEYLDVFSPGSTNNHEPVSVKEPPKNAVLKVIIYTLELFTTLFLILLLLKGFGKWVTDIRHKIADKKATKLISARAEDSTLAVAPPTGSNKDEEVAAIAMALHLYLDANHDEESEIITFDTDAPRYSPWAQKNLVLKRVVRR
jgi:hypothetical protein